MEFITGWLKANLLRAVPQLEDTSLPGKAQGRLRLTPQQVLTAISARRLAEWALEVAHRIQPARLARGPGGRPPSYADSSILLMALVQSLWRRSYAQIVDWVTTTNELAQALGFQGSTISQGQYWQRRSELGVLPFLFFFLALGAQLVRLGVVTGEELIVDSSLVEAWSLKDPGAAWQRYAGKPLRYGYKVHVVLCHQYDLPVFVLVTPAQVQDMLVGWLMLLVSALLYGFRVLVVYADAGYFDRRTFWVVQEVLHAHPAINYNLRRSGKRKLATPFFLEQWHRLVIMPRKAIERHFAWLKRYFGLKYFQCFTGVRVAQFVLLTYCAALTVALAAARYQRLDLVRCRSMVLVNL
jgi:hypothetical protein